MSEMKFQYKIQQFQTDAVQSVVKVFSGQEKAKGLDTHFHHDVGVVKQEGYGQTTLEGYEDYQHEVTDVGERNADVLLGGELLDNIQKIQQEQNIEISSEVMNAYKKGGKTVRLGAVSLDVEMETGTGKTYVYIKTMFELNKRYGWKKFIVMVPSIAIREGVKKSFDSMQDHFMQEYGKKVRCFIYSSSNLTALDTFATDNGINVMIINTQAFAASFKEDGKSNDAKRIIYSKRDEFGSRRPIDVIASVHPIIIMDEPQKMGGTKTMESLENFKPLFILNYSATHKDHHNLVYVLDAYDAYVRKIVKKIEVTAIEAKGFRGQDGYLFLDKIELSANKPPVAKLEIEVKQSGGKLKRKMVRACVGSDLYEASHGAEQYKKCVVQDIDGDAGTVTVGGGTLNVTLGAREVHGNVSEKDLRRIQIRETIETHFAKERDLFQRGIKCLSLFFIDEVAKYRQYDEDGTEKLGEYGEIFEEEYLDVYNEYLGLFVDDEPYQKYLREMCGDVRLAHRGYFSIDKKGHSIDSTVKRGSEFSDDISAYDLILKNKERLLSFEEPTRFIFSHSALREGWDNPNVFQICTLKHSDSTVSKRQEVGRGMRLCVNQEGVRMDESVLACNPQDVNRLTIIASESYVQFAKDLQKDLRENMYTRPVAATVEYFKDKFIKNADTGEGIRVDGKMANAIHNYLVRADYVDDDDKLTGKYYEDKKNNNLEPVKELLKPYEADIQHLVEGIFDPNVLKDIIAPTPNTVIKENPLNANFAKREFQELWQKINHKYAYAVTFDSEVLVAKSVKKINQNLMVSRLVFEVTNAEVTAKQKGDGGEFVVADPDNPYGSEVRKARKEVKKLAASRVKYDLVGAVAKEADITRRTAVKILQGIRGDKYLLFQQNPEEFIVNVGKIILEEKGSMVIDGITYSLTDGRFDNSIFIAKKNEQEFLKAFRSKKHIQDYVFTDGLAEKSVEKRFASDLESHDEVVVYAKLPRGFYIPTPVGNYSPDWAIAFKEGLDITHIYFVAETKGSMDESELRPIEQAKINCATRLFNVLKKADSVRYCKVNSYERLLNIIKGFDD